MSSQYLMYSSVTYAWHEQASQTSCRERKKDILPITVQLLFTMKVQSG